MWQCILFVYCAQNLILKKTIWTHRKNLCKKGIFLVISLIKKAISFLAKRATLNDSQFGDSNDCNWVFLYVCFRYVEIFCPRLMVYKGIRHNWIEISLWFYQTYKALTILKDLYWHRLRSSGLKLNSDKAYSSSNWLREYISFSQCTTWSSFSIQTFSSIVYSKSKSLG